jgi:tetratricopeptide (TPR) repeat protein
MRLRVPSLAVLLLLSAGAPLTAAPNTWYGHYLDARDKYIPAKRYKEALDSLDQAVRLKPDSALNAQTYGLEFIDYLPYFYQAKCHLALNPPDYNTAIRLFNIEEKKGRIKEREALYRELRKLRADAQAQQSGVDTAEKVSRLKQAVDKLRRDAADLHKAGSYEAALAALAQAQEAAKQLDRGTQAAITDQTQRIRDDKTRTEEAQTRARRIASALAEGQRLLQEGNAAEAKLRFETVLAQDAANAAALDGKRRAEEEILASTTKATREANLREGRSLFEAGRYEDAQRLLAEAAADPGATEAQELLARARKYVEGIQKQKETRARVDGLMAAAEKLITERRYADALVQLDSVLELEPDNARARERRRVAARLTGEEIFSELFPNTPPVLTFLVPSGEGKVISASTERQRLEVIGAALDDRGLSRIQFLQGGRIVAEHDLLDPSTGEWPRNQPVRRTFELVEGLNDIKVVVVDSLGATQEQSFQVTRTLLIWQRPWFLPSAAATSLGLLGLGYAVQRTRRRRAVRSRFNPYIAGAPVLEDDMFFGRQKLLARILNVLHHNSLMITGERRIGKTTLLHHLRKALEHDEGTDDQFFPVSTDLQGVPESGFFDAVMTDVVEQVQLRPETLATLRFRADGHGYDGRDFSHDLQRVTEDLTARTAKKVKLALLIDEVDVLNEYSERVNQRLRSIFMKTFSEHLVAIMSGVGIKRIWKSEGSPWYNFFDEIELTAFTREEAEDLIRQPVEGVFRWKPEAVEAILEYSALKPYVIQKFCIHAVNQMLERGGATITAEDVEAVRPAVLFERPEEVAPVPETASA